MHARPLLSLLNGGLIEQLVPGHSVYIRLHFYTGSQKIQSIS
jgi:hypothetical protein